MNHSTMGVSDSVEGIEWDDEMPEMNEASNISNVLWKLVDDATGKANMDINWIFKRGQYSKIRIFNDPNSMHPMQHPIHFHGQRFLVAAVNGKVPTNLVWKDTVLVPSGATVDILLEASNPGEWMAHCHISEHIEANMMLGFSVVE
jgi:suppressor of ftsI